MNKSTVSSFNSVLFFALALCTNIAVTPPPAMAETCMTEDLLMVYEPVETVKPKAKKAFKVTAHRGIQKHVSVHSLKPNVIKPVVVESAAAKQQVALKHSQGKANENDSEDYVETKGQDASSLKIGAPNHLSST